MIARTATALSATPLSTVVSITGATFLDVQSDVADALAYFAPMDQVFYLSGLVMMILGFMAWATNKKNSYRHMWGKRIFGIGTAFTVIGFNMGAFFNLIYYIMGQ